MNLRDTWAANVYRFVARPIRAAAAARRILAAFGYWRSARRREAVDGSGRATPWFTYPAIEYLEQFDFRSKSVFEFGSGNSTLFWCERALRVTSVENSPAWYDRIRLRMPDNGALHLVAEPLQYSRFLSEQEEMFDVIVVDGIERRECCVEAVRKLRPGGMIILDNVDWHQHSAAVLQTAGLLGVEFFGFGPINDYTWCTAVFFHREFDIPRRLDHRVAHGIGGLQQEEVRA